MPPSFCGQFSFFVRARSKRFQPLTLEGTWRYRKVKFVLEPYKNNPQISFRISSHNPLPLSPEAVHSQPSKTVPGSPGRALQAETGQQCHRHGAYSSGGGSDHCPPPVCLCLLRFLLTPLLLHSLPIGPSRIQEGRSSPPHSNMGACGCFQFGFGLQRVQLLPMPAQEACREGQV